MGQKTSPVSFRQGVKTSWPSKWFAKGGYSKLLLEDIAIREHIMKRMAQGYISRVEIKREKNIIEIIIHTARPGMVIGRSGAGINKLKAELSKLTKSELRINIVEVKEPNLDAYLVAYNITQQIEKRIFYKRAMKQAISRTMGGGAKGIKISCKGRLGGVEIARSETLSAGKIPLNTITADIDYACVEAKTTYGTIGVKAWIYRG